MRRLIRNLVQKMQRANIHGPTEGATTQTKGGFGDKEKAVENVWARQAVSTTMGVLTTVTPDIYTLLSRKPRR